MAILAGVPVIVSLYMGDRFGVILFAVLGILFLIPELLPFKPKATDQD